MNGLMKDLEAGRPVMIYRKTANRSEVARLMLQARGYEAHVMEGGSEAWVVKNVTTGSGKRAAASAGTRTTLSRPATAGRR